MWLDYLRVSTYIGVIGNNQASADAVMKLIFIFAISVLATLANAGHAGKPHYELRNAPYLFLKFVKAYDRSYKNTKEVLKRFAAFVINLDEIIRSNKISPGVYDINEYADYTTEEKRVYHGLENSKYFF